MAPACAGPADRPVRIFNVESSQGLGNVGRGRGFRQDARQDPTRHFQTVPAEAAGQQVREPGPACWPRSPRASPAGGRLPCASGLPGRTGGARCGTCRAAWTARDREVVAGRSRDWSGLSTRGSARASVARRRLAARRTWRAVRWATPCSQLPTRGVARRRLPCGAAPARWPERHPPRPVLYPAPWHTQNHGTVPAEQHLECRLISLAIRDFRDSPSSRLLASRDSTAARVPFQGLA